MTGRTGALGATFEILDGYKKGYRFTAFDIAIALKRKTGEVHLTGTPLRYIRMYRKATGRNIACVKRNKSLYEVMSD